MTAAELQLVPWLIAMAALLAVGLLFAWQILQRERAAHEAAQWRDLNLARFTEQLSGGQRVSGAEVLGVFEGRRVCVEDLPGPPTSVRFALTVAPRGLRELDVSRTDSRSWLDRVTRSRPDGTPDPAFVIDAGTAEHLDDLFLTGRLEQVLQDLFERHGFSHLTLRNDILRVERPLDPLDRLEDTAAVFGCLREVAWLCEGKEVRVHTHDAARLVWTAGSSQPRCPYCRDTLDPAGADPLEACGACGTLHHAGCFAEAEGCTVFGCAAGRARPLRVEPPS